MATGIQIVIESNRFGSISQELGRRLNDALDTAMLTIVAVADPLTAVDTGALRANKSLQRNGDGATVTWNQEYAAYVDQGTYKMAARPFAAPALEAATPPFLAALAKLGG